MRGRDRKDEEIVRRSKITKSSPNKLNCNNETVLLDMMRKLMEGNDEMMTK